MLGAFMANAIIGSLLFGFLLTLFEIDEKFISCISEWFPKKKFESNGTYYMAFFLVGAIIGIINYII